jgi:lycopene beta-cyclase
MKLLKVFRLQMKKYDIVIIGAGCSGLSLAHRLFNTNIKVCILESGNRENRIRKTWSYWDVYQHPFAILENNSLNNIYCIDNSSPIKLNCDKYNYKSIDSKQFDKYIFDKIDISKNIDIFFDTPVDELITEDKYIQIKSNNSIYRAKEVYDSRPHNIDASMYQVFLGYYINPISPIDKVMPRLMDFTQDKEFSFYYVIPFEDNSCLVEYTFFTPTIHPSDELKKNLDSYIKDTMGQYNLIRSEYGVIPMSPKLPALDLVKNVHKIGIRSGATRASTGYTFLNIQKQSEFFAKKIKGIHSKNPLLTIKAKILRKMDGILLRIIKNEPKQAKNIIFKMFTLNNDQTIIRFLSDIPSIFDILRIIINMPKLIFIKYAIKSLINRKI